MRWWSVAFLALALAGCTGTSGVPATGFINHDVETAYIPLEKPLYVFFEGDGAAVAIGDGIAVTNAHNANLLDSKTVIGQSINYDLLFFHTDRAPPKLATEMPRVGQRVVAYGQGKDGVLRKADGVVAALDAPVKAQCAKCEVQSAFTFEGNAGPGFSGGPVLDAGDGHLLGVVFGYVEGASYKGGRTIYAYPISRVLAELGTVENKLPTDVD